MALCWVVRSAIAPPIRRGQALAGPVVSVRVWGILTKGWRGERETVDA